MPHQAARAWMVPVGVMTVALMGLAAGCPSFVQQSQPPSDETSAQQEGELPATAAECLRLADRLSHETASPAELRLALRALERAETLTEGNPDLWIRQLQVIFLLAEPEGQAVQVMPWLDRGDALATKVKRAAPNRVEGYYFGAALLGFRAQLQEVGAMDLLPALAEAGRRAVELDETYNDAGPLVMMGMILVRAPAWPHGIGDPEEGLELLRRSTEISDYPLNRLMLAKALFLVDQTAAGCREIATVLQAPRRGRWAKTGLRHRREARLLASTNRCTNVTRTP